MATKIDRLILYNEELPLIKLQNPSIIISLLRIWSHLLKKSLMENFIFCAVHMALWHHVENQIYSFISALALDQLPQNMAR